MYYPYLYAKQWEQTAVKECASLIANSNKIIPIFDPVSKSTSTFRKNLQFYQKAGVPFIIIANPLYGDLKDKHDKVASELLKPINPQSRAIIGYNIMSGTDINDATNFLRQYPNYRICFIHQQRHPDPQSLNNITRVNLHIFIADRTSMTYQKVFSKKTRALISDGFPKQPKNAFYDNNPDEYFGDLHGNYQNLNFNGFGDYTITGSEFKPGGGPAHAVALHLTYQNPDQEVWIRHFVSDRKTGAADTPGKFLEAVEKLSNHVTSNFQSLKYSTACAEWVDLYNQQHYPGLGKAKGISIRHHIELMATLV